MSFDVKLNMQGMRVDFTSSFSSAVKGSPSSSSHLMVKFNPPQFCPWLIRIFLGCIWRKLIDWVSDFLSELYPYGRIEGADVRRRRRSTASDPTWRRRRRQIGTSVFTPSCCAKKLWLQSFCLRQQGIPRSISTQRRMDRLEPGVGFF